MGHREDIVMTREGQSGYSRAVFSCETRVFVNELGWTPSIDRATHGACPPAPGTCILDFGLSASLCVEGHIDAYLEYRRIVGAADGGVMFTPEQYERYEGVACGVCYEEGGSRSAPPLSTRATVPPLRTRGGGLVDGCR